MKHTHPDEHTHAACNCHAAQQSTQQDHDAHDHGNPFFGPFLAIAVFAVVEFAGGLWTHSLALLSDAWHMLSDVLALGLAMVAAHFAAHGYRSQRIEWWVSLVNAVLMLLVTVWIIIEALARFEHPVPVAGGYVTLIAFVGLLVNLFVAKQMHHHHHHHGGDANLNHRAAFLHVLGDLLGSIAAVLAGAVIYFTGWMAIDPILSILISCLLLVFTLNLLRDIRQQFKHKRTHHTH